MPQLVLEIGAEEIPARFLPALEAGLSQGLEKELTEAMLDFDSVETFATPRRLTVMAHGVSAVQRQMEELVTGPPKKVAYDAEGAPTKAAQGFAKTQGVDLADAFIHETDKGEYLAVRKTVGGAQALDLFSEILPRLISGLAFPKKMSWGSLEFTFGRPMRWLLAMLDDAVIPFELAGCKSSNTTNGHRVMGFGPFTVPSADAYLSVIKDQCQVMVDASERRAAIIEQGDTLSAQAGGKAVWKESLLGEVSGLVEYPKVILGDFDPSFLELPREVLLISMQSHQKSFGVEGENGDLLPHFLSTLNLAPKDLSLVKKGWERVLKARLEDARFFWKTDLGGDFLTWLDSLESVIFLAPLGSMGDKSRRLEKLCKYLAEKIAPDMKKDLARAGRFAKADLVTEMVGEFADLQGIMGGIYAKKKGESEVVSQALYEQYLPAGQDTPVPESMGGALLSIADKVDTLAGCFGLNMTPTGANDPYALRRCALGVCRILLEKGIRLNLVKLLKTALEAYGERDWKLSEEEILAKLEEFVGARLKNYFISQGHSTLVVEAALGAGIADVWGLRARIEALGEFSKESDFEQAVLTFKRAGNIIRKQGQEAGSPLTGAYSLELMEVEQEKALADKLEAVASKFSELWAADDYPALMGLLRELRPSVDGFFDNVMVMCDDEALRLNRLNMLKALVDMLSRLADFNALQV